MFKTEILIVLKTIFSLLLYQQLSCDHTVAIISHIPVQLFAGINAVNTVENQAVGNIKDIYN